MTEYNLKTNTQLLEANLEGLLFVAAGPVTVSQLAETLELSSEDIVAGLQNLAQNYLHDGGLSLQWHAGHVQLTSAAFLAPVIERFLGLEAIAKLSRPAIETLTIIAYRQPVTRPSIDAIRGVSSDGVLKSLLNKGLVQEVGRMDGPGRPILYGTTTDFLQHFGLKSLTDLPPYELLEDREEQNGNVVLKD
jgi:segregation and condensation protein B